MIKFRQCIFPVGQGGFSMGFLTKTDHNNIGRILYNYVYDCGSIDLSELDRELAQVEELLMKDNLLINTVFISHLDADHINGFNKLCKIVNGNIKNIILPYIDRKEQLYLIAVALSENKLSESYFQFITDTNKWIKDRAPEAKIFKLRAKKNIEQPFPSFEDNSFRPEDSDVIVQPEDSKVIVQIEGFEKKLNEENQETTYSHIAQKLVSSDFKEPLLFLLTYVPFQTNDELSSFGKCLKKSYPNFDINELKNILKNSKSRRALKECYSSLSRDHNAISMNLLVKTLKATRLISELPYLDRFYIDDCHIILDCYHCYHRYHLYHFEKIKYNASFLFTGDAKLSVKKYYNQWVKFLDNYLRDITFCTLPHHGSELSFNKDMVKKLPNAFFIAQASTHNKYKHPSESVIEFITKEERRYFHHVNQYNTSRIDLTYKLYTRK